MRLAILTDIHANREAFEAVLADVAARGATQIVLLGDVVGYGPDPEWCCDRAAELVGQGAIALRGNHDNAAAGASESMGGLARRAMDWTRQMLSAAQQGFLAGLPLQERLGEVLFTHASANAPGDWIYVTSDTTAAGSFKATDARVIFCGHVHVPLLVSRDIAGVVRVQGFQTAAAIPLIRSRRWLAVVGAVGQPRDGSPQAGYASYDTDTGDLTFRRVPYDPGPTMAKIRAAGLPDALATRLLVGD